MLSSYLVMSVLGIIIILLIISLIKLGKGDFQQLALKMAGEDRNRLEVLKPCPVCGSMLKKGQTVHSVYYRNAGRHENLKVEEIFTHIYGCPHCWPDNSQHPRTCPVCSKTLSKDGYLVARTYRKAGKKDHVHVVGCTECKRVR